MKGKRKARQQAPEVAPEPDKEPRGKPISLYPLTPEEALRRAMQVPPPPKDKPSE